MVQISQPHVAFIWHHGRQWHYVCVTCEQRERITYSQHNAIKQITDHYPHVVIYDSALRKITIGEPVLF